MVLPPEDVRDAGDYDAVVLGSGVYADHWLPSALELVDRCSGAWAGRPVWLFSSGPVGDPARSLTQKMGADPVDLPKIRAATGAREHRMFPGKLVRKNLPFAQRVALKIFRGMDGDFRDWDAIRAWSLGIADVLHETPRDDPEGRHRGAHRGRGFVHRPVAEVFDFVADERTEPTYNRNMLRSDKVTEGPIGVRTRFRATIRAGRRALRMDSSTQPLTGRT